MTETTTNLVIDLTHGGVKIAINLAKKGEKVYAYDIYNTLKIDEKKLLKNYKFTKMKYFRYCPFTIKKFLLSKATV